MEHQFYSYFTINDIPVLDTPKSEFKEDAKERQYSFGVGEGIGFSTRYFCRNFFSLSVHFDPTDLK
jgi:hypothetical protein